MSSATPGPWELLKVGDKVVHLCPAKDNLSILTVALEYNQKNDENDYFGAVYNPYDAILIAAAPELLAALKKYHYHDLKCSVITANDTLEEVLEWHHGRAPDCYVCKVIAKAEGRE